VFITIPATTQLYSLSLHDALPIWPRRRAHRRSERPRAARAGAPRGDTRRPAADRGGARMPCRAGGGAHDPRDRRELPAAAAGGRSEEHTSELQSRENLVCRLLLEK